jgi:hypothetical protein
MMFASFFTRVPLAFAALVSTSLALLPPHPACAQDAEPRSYSNAPVGMNFLIAGYAHTRGGIAFDPALPAENEHLKTDSAVLAYARAFDLWGMSAKFDAIVPYMWLSGSVDYLGQPVSREVNGFVDPRFRVSVNFIGAPAMSLSEFARYRQDLIVGTSLQVSAPWGRYDPDRLINIGTNRWSYKPELGLSKAIGPFTAEFAAAVTVFTDNTDFFGGKLREQAPLYTLQAHAIYNFPSGMWASFDATWFAGGRTTVNGVLDNNLQQNWRFGATFAYPIDRRNSIKLGASSGVAARTGNSFDLIAVAWQYRWGAGL